MVSAWRARDHGEDPEISPDDALTRLRFAFAALPDDVRRDLAAEAERAAWNYYAPDLEHLRIVRRREAEERERELAEEAERRRQRDKEREEEDRQREERRAAQRKAAEEARRQAEEDEAREREASEAMRRGSEAVRRGQPADLAEVSQMAKTRTYLTKVTRFGHIRNREEVDRARMAGLPSSRSSST